MHKFDVCIVGLGWLGLPLYKRLSENGLHVCGSKTSEEAARLLQSQGINAFSLRLNPQPVGNNLGYWLNCKTLVVNIPPSRKESNIETDYPEKLKQLMAMVAANTNLIFVGSTSVFGDVKGEINDDTPLSPATDSARALQICEEWITVHKPEGSIVRFAGLYGKERHPGRFFTGRNDIPDGDAPVNFIHQHDAVRVIEMLIAKDCVGIRINACAPQHPSKIEYYKTAAVAGGYDLPQFTPGGSDNRKVNCNWLLNNGFEFEKGVFSFDL